ncbi:hypothetical protein MCEMAEM4_03377 [Burkholderiaceae bacterium]
MAERSCLLRAKALTSFWAPLITQTTPARRVAVSSTSTKWMAVRSSKSTLLKPTTTTLTTGTQSGMAFTISASSKVSRWCRKTATSSRSCPLSRPPTKMSWCSISKTSPSGKLAPSHKHKRCSKPRCSQTQLQRVRLVVRAVLSRPARSTSRQVARST